MTRFAFAAACIAALSGTGFCAEQDLGARRKAAARLVDRIGRRLMVIKDASEHQGAATLSKTLKALRAADLQLRSIASDKAVASASARPESLARIAMEGTVKANLGLVRSSLSIYYGDTEGKYPSAPKDLVPKYFSSFPPVELPDHGSTGEVRIISKFEGKDLEPYIKDTGQWLYIADPKSMRWGEFIVDCSHKDRKGQEWFKY